MSRLAFNKSSLTHQKKLLKSYRDFLPSLDLKRRQLIAEQSHARKNLAEIQSQLQSVPPIVSQNIPMLSNKAIDLAKLVTVEDIEMAEQNVVGTRLPHLIHVDIGVRNYALLGKPHWVDPLVEKLKLTIKLKIELQFAEKRLELLNHAVKIITQRVNLFEKVLIPKTRSNIKKIKLFLSDAERDGVVRAKLAKKKAEVFL